jgi:hypothetical protein
MYVKDLLNRALRQLIRQVQGQLRSFTLALQELNIKEICIYFNLHVKFGLLAVGIKFITFAQGN